MRCGAPYLGIFLGMSGEDYKRVVLEETGKIHQAYPERFQRFFVPGAGHTVMLAGYYEATIDGVSFADWVRAMVNDQRSWDDRLAADE